MSKKRNLPDGIHTKPREDGNVDFVICQNGNELAAGMITGQQCGHLVTNLLTHVSTSFHNTDRPSVAHMPQDIPVVPVAHWHVSSTKIAGQRALTAQIGEAHVAFQILERDLRRVGRTMTAVSWRLQSSLTLRAMFAEFLRDFWTGLCGFGAVVRARLSAVSRKSAISFWVLVSGRSFRVFRTIKFVPNVGFREYPAADKCIYCDKEIYSELPGERRLPLGAEHIIAEGLAGELELPNASCQKCETATGALVEGDILGHTLQALRLHLQIRGKSKRPPPEVLPLTIQRNGKDQIKQIPVEDYPITFNMPLFTPSAFFRDAEGDVPLICGMQSAILKYDERLLRRKHGVTSFSSNRWDTLMLARMIAKIAHSAAVAELGSDKFSPFLKSLIAQGDKAPMRYIGSDPYFNEPSASLHEIQIGYQKFKKKHYVCVAVRLFASHHGPKYYAVVGESLESRIAMFTRVVSSKISLMLAR